MVQILSVPKPRWLGAPVPLAGWVSVSGSARGAHGEAGGARGALHQAGEAARGSARAWRASAGEERSFFCWKRKATSPKIMFDLFLFVPSCFWPCGSWDFAKRLDVWRGSKFVGQQQPSAWVCCTEKPRAKLSKAVLWGSKKGCLLGFVERH